MTSKEVLELIKIDDFIFFRSKEDNEIYQVVISNEAELVSLIRNIYVDEIIEITKLFTKQGDNYILVWDEERGLIECHDLEMLEENKDLLLELVKDNIASINFTEFACGGKNPLLQEKLEKLMKLKEWLEK